MRDLELLFMEPVFKKRVWGGNRICKEFGYPGLEDKIGECWAISAHPNGETKVKNGPYKGMGLATLWRDHKEIFGEHKSEAFPLLVKIIDTAEPASIQVHPDDEYAKVHENGSYGKAECSYIFDCDSDAFMIAGHNANTPEELHEWIRKGSWDLLLKKKTIKKGDFFQIDPGTIHAIGGNVMLIEIQENSDITYRLYDYDRLQDGKPRQLHLKQAEDVILVPEKPVQIIDANATYPVINLVDYQHYAVWKYQVKQTTSIHSKNSFLLVSVIAGEGYAGETFIRKGDHFIVPYHYGELELSGDLELIVTEPRKSMC